MTILWFIMGSGFGMMTSAAWIRASRNWSRTIITDGRPHLVKIATIDDRARVYVDGHLEP